MKIKISGRENDRECTEIDIKHRSATIRECYTGIGIETDQGLFGIAQRDSGIEVMLDGKLLWSSSDLR